MRTSYAFLLSAILTCAGCDNGTASPPIGDGGDTPDLSVSIPDLSGPQPDLAFVQPGDTCKGTALNGVWVADAKLCVVTYATGLGRARQMAVAPNGEIYLHSDGNVVVLYDSNSDGTSGNTERFTFASAAGLNHGVAISHDGAWVYASSDTTVYRWPYTGTHTPSTATAEVVVKGIPGGGSHVTRTLLFDPQGNLLVSVGSASNVDTAQDERSLVRTFTIPATIPAGGLAYLTGTVVASGVRNEVGLTYDSKGNLWGVENGRDDLSDPDFNFDIHNDNPGEEINLLNAGGVRFYGYPLCWSENMLMSGGLGATTQWADQSAEVAAGLRMTDVDCRDGSKVQKPKAVMPGHWAPLGVVEYTGHALPWAGDLFVTSHGSWNRTPATGRVLARVQRDTTGAVLSVAPILGENNGGQLRQGQWSARPVDVVQGPDQALYVSDDLGGRVLRIGYKP